MHSSELANGIMVLLSNYPYLKKSLDLMISHNSNILNNVVNLVTTAA